MRPHRIVVPALLALACRRDAPTPATTRPRAPMDAAVPRDASAPSDNPLAHPFGLSATLLSATAPLRTDAGWEVTLSLTMSNTDTVPNTVGPNRFRVTAGADGSVAEIPAARWDGPATLAPHTGATVRFTVVFPLSPDPPYEVVFALASDSSLNRPVSFPLPSVPRGRR